MILLSQGQISVGKSVTMYSGPLPGVFFIFDAGSVRALYGSMWRLWDGVDIQIVEYNPKLLEDQETQQKSWVRNDGKAITIYLLPEQIQTSTKLQGMRQLWNYFTTLYNLAKNDLNVRTVGVDTMTIAREIAADAFLETLQSTPKTADRLQLIQIEYAKPNNYIRSIHSGAQEMSEMYALSGDMQKHFVFTYHLREKYRSWVDSQGVAQSALLIDPLTNSPVLELKGLADSEKFVDISLLHEQWKESGSNIIRAKFLKCGYDVSLVGSWVISPTWDQVVRSFNKNLSPKLQVQMRGEL